jgi:hypothetical protein
MRDLDKPKNRRIRGAELVVTGGITLFLSKFLIALGPIALCGYGIYRWFLRKSYKDGIISLAVGVLLLFLLNGPLNFVPYLLYGTGGFLLALGAVFMVLPAKKTEDVEV